MNGSSAPPARRPDPGGRYGVHRRRDRHPLTDFENLSSARDATRLAAIGGAIGGVLEAYGAMLLGALRRPGADRRRRSRPASRRQIATAIRPITETLVAATPLIFAGLAVAISFRTGMFNIGGDGQFIIGALGATVAVLILRGRAGAGSSCSARSSPGSCPGPSGASSRASSRRGRAPTRSSRRSCSTTSRPRSCSSRLRDRLPPAAGQHAQPISKVLTAHRPTSRASSTCPAIRLDYGFVVALLMAAVVSWLLFRTTQGLRAPRCGLQPDGRPLRGHERRRLDDARDVALRRARRPGRRRSWSSAPSASCRHDISRRHRLQRHRARAARRPAAERRRPRRPAVRRADERRQG